MPQVLNNMKQTLKHTQRVFQRFICTQYILSILFSDHVLLLIAGCFLIMTLYIRRDHIKAIIELSQTDSLEKKPT